MPSKKQKESVPSSSSEAEAEEDYDSEEMQESSDDANLGDGQMREVDSRNVLNYETDSDEDEDGMSSDDLGANLEA